MTQSELADRIGTLLFTISGGDLDITPEEAAELVEELKLLGVLNITEENEA